MMSQSSAVTLYFRGPVRHLPIHSTCTGFLPGPPAPPNNKLLALRPLSQGWLRGSKTANDFLYSINMSGGVSRCAAALYPMMGGPQVKSIFPFPYG